MPRMPASECGPEITLPGAVRAGDDCDVIVIGGGPAGTTAASLLARRGWSVTLLEREVHPRFHIGESLLPLNLPVFETLGVLEEVEAIGVRKPAADFTGPGCHDHTTFPFAEALGSSPDHAFQVLRSELDHLLLQGCRRSGVTVLENVRADSVSAAGKGFHEVVAVSGDTEEHERMRCRFVVDASGQDSLMARQRGWRKRDRRHSAAAFFAHFADVPRRPAPWSGNISIYWFEGGWIWMIPLREGITSVGAVCDSAYARSERRGREDFFESALARCPAATNRLRGARRLSPVRSAANYSYVSSRQSGDGFALVGDAYTFVDPVFSSGVYIAMSSATMLVPLVDQWLRGARWRYRVAAVAYRRKVRKGVRTFKWFIYRFNTPAMAWLFGNPRNFLKVEQAVVSVLAGDVFAHRTLRMRLLLFKALYAVVAVVHRLAPSALGTEPRGLGDAGAVR